MTFHRLDSEFQIPMKPEQHSLKTAGLVLVGAGLIFALDQTLRTGWLTLIVLPLIGGIGFVSGIRQNRRSWLIPGALVGGLGLGGLALLGRIGEFSILLRVGLLLFFFGLGWAGIFVSSICLNFYILIVFHCYWNCIIIYID